MPFCKSLREFVGQERGGKRKKTGKRTRAHWTERPAPRTGQTVPKSRKERGDPAKDPRTPARRWSWKPPIQASFQAARGGGTDRVQSNELFEKLSQGQGVMCITHSSEKDEVSLASISMLMVPPVQLGSACVPSVPRRLGIYIGFIATRQNEP